MIGGTVLQTLILLWITFRTDWIKEVSFASQEHLCIEWIVQCLTFFSYKKIYLRDRTRVTNKFYQRINEIF